MMSSPPTLDDRAGVSTVPSQGLDRDYIYRSLRKITLMGYANLYTSRISTNWTNMLTALTRRDALEQQRKNMDRSRERLSDELNDYIAVYTAPECQLLCDYMQQHLPLELRDMIYGYLFSEPCVLIEATDFLPSDSEGSSRPRLLDSPHLMNPKFCDAITQREIFEAWYKSTTFQFADNSLVSDFLAKDLWGLDLPVSELVRNLEIEIWPTSCMYKDTRKCCTSSIAHLECLCTLRKGARIVFPIMTLPPMEIWCPSDEHVELFVRVLSLTFPFTQRLLSMGHHVSYEVDDCLVVDVTAEDLTKDQWCRKIKDKKKEQQRQSEDSATTV